MFWIKSSRLLRPSRPTASFNHLTWPAGPPGEEESRNKSRASPANVTGRGNGQRLDKQGEIRDCCAHRQLLHSQITAAGGEVDCCGVFMLLMLTLSLSRWTVFPRR